MIFNVDYFLENLKYNLNLYFIKHINRIIITGFHYLIIRERTVIIVGKFLLLSKSEHYQCVFNKKSPIFKGAFITLFININSGQAA
jgi:hypothetical protein